jgi:geranylgeranyl pyrophosphate synthase
MRTFFDMLNTGSGYFDKISKSGFFSLVLTNNDKYHAFSVSGKENLAKAVDFANNEDSINKNYLDRYTKEINKNLDTLPFNTRHTAGLKQAFIKSGINVLLNISH